MKISKRAALNYVDNESYFFKTRALRNSALPGDEVQPGLRIAVAEDEDVDMDDETSALWFIEMFNGSNWVLETFDPNYSLVVTDRGLEALADIREGKYVFDISCIKVKEKVIQNPSKPMTQWQNYDFVSEGDIVLDTGRDDESFSLNNNKTLTWRKSLGSSGIQFTLLIDSDTAGSINSQRKEEYTIGAVGFYIKDQVGDNTEDRDGILFAIGNLSQPINKYVTNANRVGNAVKLYFNFAISNLGNLANITCSPEDCHSLPEVASEDFLESRTATTPSSVYSYNAYLVDNYRKTNAPALALRTNELVKITESGIEKYKYKWTYMTPQDDTIPLTANDFDEHCKNYMAVSWDAEKGKFVPADGDRILNVTSIEQTSGTNLTNLRIDKATFENKVHPTDDMTMKFKYSGTNSRWKRGSANVELSDYGVSYQGVAEDGNELTVYYYKNSTNNDTNLVKSQTLTGLKIDNSVLFAGNVRNYSYLYEYKATLSSIHLGRDYRTGDILVYPEPGNAKFLCSVTNVTDPFRSIAEDGISEISPKYGNEEFNTGFTYWYCARRNDQDESYEKANVVQIQISSERTEGKNYIWNFPSDWLNKPLYADVGENAGKFTTNETECFIGWCTGTGQNNSSIKLALDLRNEATDTEYGTTRYATNYEVSNVNGNSGTAQITSVTPKRLQDNYLQKTQVSGNPGESLSNPVEVDSYVKFNQTIIGKGAGGIDISSPDENVSFYGLAYRARWGDLAEYYESDVIYPAGTLITIGSGPKEITIANRECNGIISDKPGYELGNKLNANYLPVALVGKVPVMFDKKCVPHFGDRVYLSRYEDGRASTECNGFCLGKIIDKRPDLEKCKTVLCSIRISF